MIFALLANLSGTLITLQPSTDPAAVADVVMENRMVNGPQDEVSFVLEMDGLPVEGRFDWDAGMAGEDRVIVTPPLGMFCKPDDCTLTVIEGTTGRLRLYEYLGF